MSPSSSQHGYEPESSAQALERYILDQLSSLSLSVPQDDIEMMARFVEEEGLERDEKLEGAKGMLEGVVEGCVLPEEGVDEALERIVDEQTRLKELDEERAREEEEAARSPSPTSKPHANPSDILSSLTPEELAAAQRQALLRQYAYVDADEAEINALMVGSSRDGNAPPKGLSGKDSEEKKAAEERRKMVEAALRLDGKKKKFRKQQEVDLLAPNLNREKVAMRAQMEREAQKRDSQTRKDRDKAALDKQRADQAKAKADRQKKAAKQERRG
ncbi:hypothetical protein I317_03908 [Kwoniella heveanensis CBS 569]|uniref:Coiled-coil domain-containing protein 43 n=1 Tax=Kwoniella heveanensis BCC8398 TaxID=1296120 RepID=A0A1B9GSK4_9TREE|nr:hypothetical protein I316_04397 [Kwoniella heveanensis BCC8398]OCF42288.1 hypothetical protein I317_03908 [Kwoniella heveanensis CBS 569]